MIKDLRNSRDVDQNWSKFIKLVEDNKDTIIDTFNIRWIISICDTIVDYDVDPRKTKAMVLVTFVTMIKFSETVKMTVDWYKLNYTNPDIIQKITIKQIKEYEKLIYKRGIK